jgi:prepilin-type N-terminal cleavage/methylation domain-containing protein
VRRHGFTLVEVLVSLAIVALLAALLTPVFARAKDRAQVAESVLKLKQCHLALQLYRDQWDGDDTSGDFFRMGLWQEWDMRQLWWDFVEIPEDFLQSPCKRAYSGFSNLSIKWNQITYAPDYYNKWAELNGNNVGYLAKYRWRALAFMDTYCTDPPLEPFNPYRTKRFLAILLNGELVNKRRAGSMYRFENWSDPP